MVFKKDFYFVRHGQTDHNIVEGGFLQKGDHPVDISLNETGKNQAFSIEPLIAQLSIQAVFASPFQRVKETKNIITSRLEVPHFDVHELGECSAMVWHEMTVHGMYTKPLEHGLVNHFMNRVKNGINQALVHPGRPLIVAHGGIHWAICSLLGIKNHSWSFNNCVPVHFQLSPENQWVAKIL